MSIRYIFYEQKFIYLQQNAIEDLVFTYINSNYEVLNFEGCYTSRIAEILKLMVKEFAACIYREMAVSDMCMHRFTLNLIW